MQTRLEMGPHCVWLRYHAGGEENLFCSKLFYFICSPRQLQSRDQAGLKACSPPGFLARGGGPQSGFPS